MPCFSGIMTKETAEHGWIAGICHEKAVQSHLLTCCDAGSHFQSRVADRGDHECSKELSYLFKFLFLSFVVSHFERLLFWSSLVRLLVLLACVPNHSPETCDWGSNSHWGCCHDFSLWNGGNVILPLFFIFFYLKG